MRMGPDCDPVANLAGEGGSLSEIYFHQVNPDHFFSCAQSGQVCHWYPAERLSNPLQSKIICSVFFDTFMYCVRLIFYKVLFQIL